MSNTNFQVLQSYSFQPWPEAIGILGNRFNNLTVVAEFDRATAELFADITAAHQQLMPYLPAGSSPNPDDYTYIKVRLDSGQETILSTGWINPDTITQIQAARVNIVVSGVNVSDVPAIRNALISNGFDQLEISLV